MNKKILAAGIGLMMMAGALAGCGGDTKSGDAKKEEPAKAANEIKIGGNFELTGNQANYGKQALNGVQLAFKEANENGGVLGKKLVLVTADNKSEPAESTNAVTKLMTKDKVVAVIGPTMSSNVLATVQVANDNKILVLTPTGTNDKVTVDNDKVRPYVFRACFIDPFQGDVVASFAQKTLNAKTAVIYVDNSADYSKGLAKAFQAAFEKAGGKIVSQEAYLQKDQDFKATLTKIKAANPDIVFLPGYYEEVGKILKQAREMGMELPFLGGDGWSDPKISEIAGPGPTNNSYYTDLFSSQDTDPGVVKFITAYKAEYNQEPGSYAAMGYDAGLLIIDAIKRAGSDEPDKIRAALEASKDVSVSSGTITLDANHNPIRSAVIIEMIDGKQMFKEKVQP